jgi:CspA family cold shock protein
MDGTIARLVRARGFGFIKTEDGQEIFFHATGVKESTFEELSEGQSVTFTTEMDPRTGKERATNVTPA